MNQLHKPFFVHIEPENRGISLHRKLSEALSWSLLPDFGTYFLKNGPIKASFCLFRLFLIPTTNTDTTIFTV